MANWKSQGAQLTEFLIHRVREFKRIERGMLDSHNGHFRAVESPRGDEASERCFGAFIGPANLRADMDFGFQFSGGLEEILKP